MTLDSIFSQHSDPIYTTHGRDRESTTILRLYAINVAAALDHKFTILWTFNVTLTGTLPYLSTSDTYCNSVPPNDNDNSSGKSHKVLEHPPGVLTTVGGRILGAVSIERESGDSISFNLSVRDLGGNYSVISSGYSDDLLDSLSWSNNREEEKEKQSTFTEKKGELAQSVEEERLWASVWLPRENKTVLELLLELNGPPVNSSFLVLSTNLTTPVTLLQFPTSEDLLVFGASDSVSGVGVGGGPHLVGVVGEEGGGGGREGGVVPTMKWSVPLPHSQPAQGQISSLSFSSRTLLFVTSPLGVYAYQLT